VIFMGALLVSWTCRASLRLDSSSGASHVPVSQHWHALCIFQKSAHQQRRGRNAGGIMEQAIAKLGYVTFATMLIAAAAATTVLIREIPGIVRYIKISKM